MRTSVFKKGSIGFYLAFVLILVTVIGGAAVGTFADGPTVTTQVSGGSLTESAPSSVAATPVTLNGQDQTTRYSMRINLVDARGSGDGWSLTIASTQFSAAFGVPRLPADASHINSAPSQACAPMSTCTLATNTVSYPLLIPTDGSTVKFFNAAKNTGRGNIILTPTVTISIPANTFALTYTSTITLSVISGP